MKKRIAVAACAAMFVTPALASDMVVQKGNSWFKGGQSTLEQKLAQAPITKKAKNVILFVADGYGVNSNYATRLYMGQKAGGYGDENILPVETFPHLALAKTYNTNGQTPDSAGTSSAMNTGVKTKAGVIGISEKAHRSVCEDVKPNVVTSFAEQMHAEGKSIGVVTTARLTHATPAGVYAHSGDRNWEDNHYLPEGCDQKDIAVQLFDKMVEGEVDLALGGGRRHFIPKDGVDKEGKKGKRTDGRNLVEEAKAKGMQYSWDDATFASLKLDGQAPVLGLFESSHMKYEYDRTNEPSLAEMTEAAITYLSQNKEGYYLVVESGRVDHANHAGNAFRTLTDAEAFQKAVSKALEMTSPEDTLIISTADHAHSFALNGYCGRGSNILGLCYKVDPNGEKFLNEPNLADDGKPYTVLGYLNGPGSILRKQEDGSWVGTRPVVTEEEAVDPDYLQQSLIPLLESESHSGTDVAIYASGPWAHLFNGTVEQNFIYHVMDYAVHNEK